jgi:hypothetical protein
MIKASYTLNWSGGEYSVRLHRELVRAVGKSALLVERSAKKMLANSGKSMTAKSGINQIGSRTGSMAAMNRFIAFIGTQVRYSAGCNPRNQARRQTSRLADCNRPLRHNF